MYHDPQCNTCTTGSVVCHHGDAIAQSVSSEVDQHKLGFHVQAEYWAEPQNTSYLDMRHTPQKVEEANAAVRAS